MSRNKYDAQPSNVVKDGGVSFPSKGPLLTEQGHTITNDHSVLTDVAGQHVWLHRDKHVFDGKRVHLQHSHAVDNNLIDQSDEEATPQAQPKPEHVQPLSQGHSGNKPAEKTTSAMSSTRPDDGARPNKVA